MRTLALFLSFSIGSLFADQAAEQLIRASYKLEGDGSTATGFVIHDEDKDKKRQLYLVTADHVLANMRGSSCKLISRKPGADGGFSRQPVEIKIRENGDRVWRKHPKHDLAVLSLGENPKLASLPLSCLIDDTGLTNQDVGADLRICVFPEHFEANGAGFPVLRNGSIASYPLEKPKLHATFLIDVEAWSGDSGGPVAFHSQGEKLPRIIGIVLGMHRVTEKDQVSRFEERITHYPLGISYALHASFARRMIEE